ncbi:hypothetical protein RGQ29_023317 [Quercus rubra]|uniref:Uncharacterized protein n=1 Tax=Quercus rubra TaxID=3512 RepID=A0AAN7ILI4_QUERU|nr:hypothetical protein RGQ29_023317 [Quercus rubra]
MRENSQLSLMGCGSFSPNAKQDVFLSKLGYHLQLPTRQQWRLGHYPLIAAQGANCARSSTERLSAPSIGVYQDKDSNREAKCHNSALEEFKPRLPKRQCRQCS